MATAADAWDVIPMGGRVNRTVEVQATSVLVHELIISLPSVAGYLSTIPPDKLELALAHALDVGVTEILARKKKT
jgi:hypothetical protein